MLLTVFVCGGGSREGFENRWGLLESGRYGRIHCTDFDVWLAELPCVFHSRFYGNALGLRKAVLLLLTNLHAAAFVLAAKPNKLPP